MKFKDTYDIKLFEKEYLLENSKSWLKSCLEELKTSISSVFKYATNLKSLVLIRDAIFQFDQTLTTKKPNETNSDDWSHVCEYLFNERIDLWTVLISPFYYSQSKLIIDSSFKLANENLINSLESTLVELMNDQK